MKTKNKPHFLLMAAIVAVFAAFTVSCNKDDDPSLADLREDKLQYLEDSLRISDSLRLIGNAGVVNYSITVVDGSTSSIYANGRTNESKSAVDGAIVTISQYGKTLTDTTDASGTVVFNGFFRSAVNVTIKKTDYTSVSYISGVHIQDSTRTGTISFVGNIIPIFALTGANTANISGRATIETNLTNRTVELAPDGTTVSASIDATNNSDFSDKFLTTDIDDRIYISSCGCEFVYVGNILQASYSTGIVGTVASGNYSITVPAAIDGLPLNLQYSDVAADQTLFQLNGSDQNSIVRRTIYTANPFASAATLPASTNVSVAFESFDAQATATAVISAQAGTVERINVTNGGSGYIAATPPLVQIVGDGTGATATATVGANGRVTGVTLTSPGSGYTTVSSVNFLSGSGATASAGLQANGTVTSIVITNSGSGYTSAPTVTIPAPGGTGTQAQGTANIDALGRVTSITITNPGTGYAADPGAITIAAPPAGGVQAVANALYSGVSVGNVTVTPGSGYTYAPTVTFSAPQRANGVRATGTASFDATTGQVTGIQVTNAGSGYTAAPTVTLNAGSGAAAQGYLTGGSVISFNITSTGDDYAYAPTVVIGRTDDGNGSGATGTAVMSNGRVVGINLTNGGSGYTSAPSVELVTGTGAVAYAIVNGSGSITGFNIAKGGSGYTGAPRVIINGGGTPEASATATVTGGAVTGMTVVLGGSGYTSGNIPASAQNFSTTKGSFIETKPGLKYINDVNYGTGTIRN
ncbi:MAG TPA: hypothetical protein VGD65_26290 [Chryseosolibacter sp.]